jgi:hypothetical protein
MIEWIAVPFGLCKTRATLHRMMLNDTFRDFLPNFITLYLHDVRVNNRTLEEHLEQLRLVLQRFKEEAGLEITF